MLVYYLGIPGSGKTYSAVHTIYNNFSDDKDAKKDLKKDYINCYTNINEFKFEKLKNVFKLEYDNLYSNLIILYNLYKEKCTDDVLIEKAKELDIYKTLFVVDECHTFFDTADTIKIWWLTYHRHLYHDIILITQNLALVNTKYKPLAEAFYRAKPNSLVLNHKFFHYTYFTDSRLTKAGRVNVKKIKKDKKVFELYKSGDSVKSKNVIVYFLTIAFILFIILFIVAFFFFSSKNDDSKIKKSDNIKPSQYHKDLNTNSHINKKLYSSNLDDSDDVFLNKRLIVFNCSFSDCSSDNFSIPPQLLKKFIDMNKAHIYYKKMVNKSLSVFYISVSNSLYNFLNSQKGVKNEINPVSSPISLFGSK